MNLSTKQVSNLTLLADFMERLKTRKFTMTRYVNWESSGCNSPACALGWACTVPSLIAAGLDMKVLDNFLPGEPSAMAQRVFGDYSNLFDANLAVKICTPQQWAAHCRAFLKDNGYEVKPDPFKTFMDRALVPVETREIQNAEEAK